MKRLLTMAVLAIGFAIAGGEVGGEARADRDWDGRHGRYQRHWRDYDRWYGGYYRPYYNYYYSRPYHDDYYFGRYYGTPRFGYRDYGDGGTVRVGPLRIFW